MKSVYRAVPCLLGLTLSACGGGGSNGPTPLPSTTTVPGVTVNVVVFQDDNANGLLDAGEIRRERLSRLLRSHG